MDFWKVCDESTVTDVVSSEFLLPHIREVHCYRVGLKTTVCCVALKNGFEVIGTSACIDPASYVKEIGEKFALEDALRRCVPLIGFYNQQKRHEGKDWTSDTEGAGE